MEQSENLHSAGGKVKIDLLDGMKGWARFSPDGKHRYALGRSWGEGEYALWCGMNPSTAEANVDDPTVRWEVNYTKNVLGLNNYVKVNVMDYRATSPLRLLLPEVVPCSDKNKAAIKLLAKRASKIIMVYGALHPSLLHYGQEVTDMLRAEGHELFCLGLNKGGTPKHPLYLRRDTPLQPFGD
jgi:hypothetical protein